MIIIFFSIFIGVLIGLFGFVFKEISPAISGFLTEDSLEEFNSILGLPEEALEYINVCLNTVDGKLLEKIDLVSKLNKSIDISDYFDYKEVLTGFQEKLKGVSKSEAYDQIMDANTQGSIGHIKNNFWQIKYNGQTLKEIYDEIDNSNNAVQAYQDDQLDDLTCDTNNEKCIYLKGIYDNFTLILDNLEKYKGNYDNASLNFNETFNKIWDLMYDAEALLDDVIGPEAFAKYTNYLSCKFIRKDFIFFIDQLSIVLGGALYDTMTCTLTCALLTFLSIFFIGGAINRCYSEKKEDDKKNDKENNPDKSNNEDLKTVENQKDNNTSNSRGYMDNANPNNIDDTTNNRLDSPPKDGVYVYNKY